MDDKISVLMGVYNAHEVIVQAVTTIEEQTDQNFEFVICDDASVDDTYRILKDLTAKYRNIILLHNEVNQGLAFALNNCLMHSHGKYIARMDADDRCVPQRFAIQRAFLDAHPEYALVGSEMVMIDEHGRKTYSRIPRIPTRDIFPLNVPFFHPTVLMRREVLEKLGCYSVEKFTRRCEDLDLWYRFFHSGFRGYNLPDYLYIKGQGIDDYRKRKISHGFEMFVIHLRGLHLIHAPAHKYLLAVKPIISAAVPKRIMKAYHDWIFRKKNI